MDSFQERFRSIAPMVDGLEKDRERKASGSGFPRSHRRNTVLKRNANGALPGAVSLDRTDPNGLEKDRERRAFRSGFPRSHRTGAGPSRHPNGALPGAVYLDWSRRVATGVRHPETPNAPKPGTNFLNRYIDMVFIFIFIYLSILHIARLSQ